MKYSTYDRELLAIFMAIKHFRYLIEGRELTVMTDHKPLTFALSKKESKADSPRRLRQLDFIAQFCNKIEYIEGELNNAADFLSRLEEIKLPTTFDYEQLYKSQIEDKELETLRQKNNLQFKSFNLPDVEQQLIFETAGNKARLYLPAQFRERAISSTHALSHPGASATRRLITQRYFWPGMNADVTKYVRSCIPCQKAKIQRHTITPLGEFENSNRFEHVHIDIIGPLKQSEEYTYCLTIIDRATKWIEVIPIKDISAQTVGNKFIEHWISRYGCPTRITTDQGRQFESQLFTQLTKRLGIEKIHTCAYNPKANGTVERMHRTLKAALMARCKDTAYWAQELPLVLLGLRSAIKKDIGFSPAQLTFGKSLRLPGDFFIPTERTETDTENTTKLMDTLASLRPNNTRVQTTKKIFMHKDLQESDFVFIKQEARRSLTPPYEGPFRVISKHSKFYTIKMGSREVTVSLDRLKPAYVIIPPLNETQSFDASTEKQTKALSESPSPITSTIPVPAKAIVTRSGRTVKKTVRFDT